MSTQAPVSGRFAEPAGRYGVVAVVDCQCGVFTAADLGTAERRADFHRTFQGHDADARLANE
jgi:hypothetical protein